MNFSKKKRFKISLIIFVIGIVISITAYSLGGRINSSSAKNSINFSEVYTGIETLDIDLGLSDVELKKGNEFKIEANNVSSNTFSSSVENGKWNIRDNMPSKIFNINHYNNIVTVYIPELFENSKIKIKIGAGQLIVNQLTANNIDINIGAGNLKMDNLTATEVNIDCGVGNIEINGEISDKGNVKCGVGNVSLNLKGNKKDYKYNLNVGIGEISLNNNNYNGLGNKVTQNISSSKLLKVDCGIGKLSLNIN